MEEGRNNIVGGKGGDNNAIALLLSRKSFKKLLRRARGGVGGAEAGGVLTMTKGRSVEEGHRSGQGVVRPRHRAEGTEPERRERKHQREEGEEEEVESSPLRRWEEPPS